MDFLGLKTLTIIKNALELINKIMDSKLILIQSHWMMQKHLHFTSTAETIGTFQFESPGMQKYLRDLKPTNLMI